MYAIRSYYGNVHRGGSVEVVDLPENYQRVAIQAAQIMGLRVAGVDLLEGSDGPQIIRITSYNVCYTKLLRFERHFFRRVSIIKYNLCIAYDDSHLGIFSCVECCWRYEFCGATVVELVQVDGVGRFSKS